MDAPPREDNADFQAAELIIQHNREGIGMIQSALAGAIDPMLRVNGESVSAIRKQLTRQANQIRKVTRNTSGAIATELGRITTDIIAQPAQVKAVIGQAAATGRLHEPAALHPLMPPDPPPAPHGGIETRPAGHAPPQAMPNIQPGVNYVTITGENEYQQSPLGPKPPGYVAGTEPAPPSPLGTLPTCATSWIDYAKTDPTYAWLLQPGPFYYWAKEGGCLVTYEGGNAPQPGMQLLYTGDADTAMRYCFGCPPVVAAAPNPPPPVVAPPPQAVAPTPVVAPPLPPVVAPTPQPRVRVQPPSCQSFVVVAPTPSNYCQWLAAISANIVEWGRFILANLQQDRSGWHITGGTFHRMFVWAVGADADKEEISPIIDQVLGGSEWWDDIERWNCLLDSYGVQAGSDVRAAMAVKQVLESWQSLTVSTSHSEGASTGESSSWGLKALGLGSATETSASSSKGGSLALNLKAAIVPALDIVDQVIRYLMPTHIPGAGDAISSYLANQISWDECQCLLRANDVRNDLAQATVNTRRNKVSESERIEYGYRSSESEVQLREGLREYGYLHTSDLDKRLALWFSLPDPSSATQFVTRRTADATFVATYGTDAGFATALWPTYKVSFESQGVSKDLAYAQWLSHWTLPGIGTLQEMLYRSSEMSANAGLQFTIDDYTNWISCHGFPPWITSRLTALAYRPVSLRYLRAGMDSGALGPADAQATLAAQGYAPTVVTALVQSEVHLSARRRAKQYGTYDLQQVVKMIHSGVVDQKDALTYLPNQGYSAADISAAVDAYNNEYISGLEEGTRHEAIRKYAGVVLSAYRDGTLDRPTALSALLSVAYIDSAANLELDSIDLQIRQQTTAEATKAIRKAFLSGAVDGQGVQNALVLSGMTAAMSAVLAGRWALELTTPRVAASAALAIRLTGQGIMSIGNMQQRLANLGWTPDAIALETVEIQNTLATAQKKATATQAKQVAAAQKAAKAVLSATQKTFCRLYTPGKMVRWYALRIIDDAEFNTRLTQCGYIPSAIDKLLAEAVDARAKADAAKAKGAVAPKSPQPKPLAAGTLKRLYAERILDDAALSNGLQALGYTGSQLSELENDARVERAAKDQKAAKSGATGIQLTGPGAVAGGAAP